MEITHVSLDPKRLEAFASMPFHDGLVALWNAILDTCGLPSLSDSLEPVKPIDRASIMMTWCNVGPSVSDVERGAYFTGPTFPPASLV